MAWDSNNSSIGMSIEIEPPVSTGMIFKVENLGGLSQAQLSEKFLAGFGSHAKYSKVLKV